MSIDWNGLQDCLYALSVETIQAFAAEHRREVFYGFIFDCNADYGDVLLCLNTEKDFKKSAAEFPDESEEWRQTELRWFPGDWKYQGINSYWVGKLSQRFDAVWKPYKRQVSDLCMQQWHSRGPYACATLFLESVSRVLICMEQNSVFDCIRRTDDFRALVCDHDEPFEEGWRRVDRVRLSPIDPHQDERADAVTAEYELLSHVFTAVDTQRKEKLPYSDVKLLLRDSLVIRRFDNDWWVAYENEKQAFTVCYNPAENAYRVSLAGRTDVIVPDIRQVAEQLQKRDAG